MFRQFDKRRDDESGMVMVTVLMIVAVMMIFSISILSQHMTRSRSSQAQIEQIRAEQLAKGAFWKAYSAGFSSLDPASSTINGKTYTSTITSPGGNKYNVQVSY